MSDASRLPQAVLGRRTPAQDVSERDFERPLRLGEARTQALKVALVDALPALEKKLLESAGLRLALSFGAFGEVDADDLFRPAKMPCVLRFQIGNTPAWLSWPLAAAATAVESLLGVKAAESPGRKLSPTESRIATQFLGEIARAVSAVLGMEASAFALVQSAAELGSWRDGGPGAESYRFEVRLKVRLGEQASKLQLYLPAPADEREGQASLVPERLPKHLEEVEIELSAELSGCEISFDQLLELEAGDVIPLEARLGDPTLLCVDGLPLARGRLGSHRGRLAVRIEHLAAEPRPSA